MKEETLNRKTFIEAQGATCQNWQWSWSFINETAKVIIFGAWDIHTEKGISLILSEVWEINSKGRKPPGYNQSREHIRLIEEDGYQLKTFPIFYSDANKDEKGVGPSKIDGFVPELTNKVLLKNKDEWYASDVNVSIFLPEELNHPEKYIEGASKTISVNSYERNIGARKKCLEHYGYKCTACSFDFKKYYGDIGIEYIHVHHKNPLSEIKKEYELDPITDLVPVCPNCHAMIHRSSEMLTIEQLKERISKNGKW